jgi:uncharacterized protein YgbK (DUF1537 family)
MKLPGLTIGIVADDLTGANDAALPFFLHGSPTTVLLSPRALVEADSHVWVVNTDSRHMEPREAAQVTRRAIDLLRNEYGVDNFYKKMDSTLRGPVAAECLAALEELKWDCAVIAPALPQEGRRTVGGYQLVRGMPVEQTEVARDPLAPVRQSHIPTLLAQTVGPEMVGHIELSTILHGAGPIYVALSELIKQGKKLIVADACSNVDVEQIALAIENARKTFKVLPCGSAGLAKALTKFWTGDAPEPWPVKLAPSPTLVVVGSATQTTRHQLRQLIEHYPYYGEGSRLMVIHLTAEQVLGLAPLEAERVLALEAMGDNNTVVLTTSLDDHALNDTLELAEQHQIPPQNASRLALERLSVLVQSLIAEKPSKLILSGGETATQICRALGCQSLRMVAEVEPSIPLTVDSSGDSPRWIVTKSGNLGSPLALANIVRTLKQLESRDD